MDFDVAILDLKLGTEMTFAVADLLVERKKAFIFSTGFGEAEVSDRYSQPVLEKPYDEARLSEPIARRSGDVLTSAASKHFSPP